MDKYRVVEGSETAHCCFQYSIMDNENEDEGMPIAECFEKEVADKIVLALNKLESSDE